MTRSIFAAAILSLSTVGAFAQNNDGCDSVLIYAGNNITNALSVQERDAFHYMSKCTSRASSGNLSIAYEAFKLGGGGNSSKVSCETDTQLNNEAIFDAISLKVPVQSAIQAWSQCKSLVEGRITPDISDTGNLVTVGVKNSNNTQPIKVTLDFKPTDAYGNVEKHCEVMYQGAQVSTKVPFTQEVSALERVAIRCDRKVFQYTTNQGQNATIRPGGVVTIDTPSASYLMPVFDKDSSLEDRDQRLAQSILKSAGDMIRGSRVTLANCAYPFDGGWWNNYDHPVDKQCPADQVMVGENSVHNNHFEDRTIRYKCCSMVIAPTQ